MTSGSKNGRKIQWYGKPQHLKKITIQIAETSNSADSNNKQNNQNSLQPSNTSLWSRLLQCLNLCLPYIDYHKSNTVLQFDTYFNSQIHLYIGRGKYRVFHNVLHDYIYNKNPHTRQHVDAFVAITWILYRCAVSPVVHTLNISSCQKKKLFSVFLWLWKIPLR
jgi:hypothetical protein